MVTRKSNFMRVKEVLNKRQGKKIGRFSLDMQTANAIVAVDKALKPDKRAKFRRIVNSDIRRGSLIAQKLAFR